MIWGLLGFTAGLLLLCYMVLNEFLLKIASFEAHRVLIAASLCLLGVVLGFIGCARTRRAHALTPPPVEGEEPDSAPQERTLIPLFSPQHWALTLVLFSATMLLAKAPSAVVPQSCASPKPVVVQAAKPAAPAPPAVVAAPVALPAKPPAPSSFLPPPSVPEKLAKLHLQGIVFRETNPSAIIDQQTYYVGDRVSGAEIVQITRNHVAVRFDGVTTLLKFRDTP